MEEDHLLVEEMIRHQSEQSEKKLIIDIAHALNQSAVISITDSSGKIIYINQLFTKISQYEPEELIGKDHRLLNSGYHPPEFFQKMWETIRSGETWRGEIRNRRKDGTFYWIDTTIVPFLSESGTPYQYIAIRNDITSRKETERIVRDLAYNDQLTHLPNRTFFRKIVHDEVMHAKKHGESLAFVHLNIDRLRYANDSLGHEAGDYILSTVAKRLKELLKEEQCIGRLTGDEFGLLLKNIKNEEHAVHLTEEIRQYLQKPFNVMGHPYSLSFSFGIALFPDHAKKPSELTMKAEKALSSARENGGGNYEMYKHGTASQTLERILLENELRKSVELGQLHLDYQPKVHLQTGEIVGLEALVRWNHPDLGRIPPDKFIPVAEETKIIISLGEWVLREACKQAKKWRQDGFAPFRIAVNMSAVQLEDPSIVSTIQNVLHETGATSDYIEIELTESAFADREGLQDTIEEIRKLGISVAIDDFGTGYSTFSYIKELPADKIKIDRAFINDIHLKEESRAIVKAIMELANTVGLSVVAEGVECEEQILILRDYGCQEGQGYYYSKPCSPEQCEMLMKKLNTDE